MGFFDWFKKEKQASNDLTLNSIEFPWPEDRATNHVRGNEHWQHSSCLGSQKAAIQIYFSPGAPSKDTETGALIPSELLKWGRCPSCGKKGRVTNSDKTFHHLPVSSAS